MSTTEVSQILSSDLNVAEANVYGVKIPGHDGKAGCAAIVLASTSDPDSMDWAKFAARLRSELPPFAVPLFLRIRVSSVATATDNYKQRKQPLQDEGVKPDALGSKIPHGQHDRIYWMRPGSATYTPFEESDWISILDSRAKL